ncbi:MAG: cupin domain-containing protein, partial [Candidatus Hodarchaeales archaeon]
KHSTQFGIVFEGEIELTIDGMTRKYSKGDSYYIPEGAIHSAKFLTDVKVMDFFDEPDRYPKKK